MFPRLLMPPKYWERPEKLVVSYMMRTMGKLIKALEGVNLLSRLTYNKIRVPIL